MLPFALGLAACSGGSPLDKGNVITPKFMERNFVDTKNPTVVEDKYEIEKVVDVGEYTVQGALLGGQILKLADADGKIGWYSVYYNKMLVPFGEYVAGTTLYAESVEDVFEEDIYFPVYGVADEEGENIAWHVVDEMGTEIYSVTTTAESQDSPYLSGRLLAESERTDNEYYVVFIEGYSAKGYGLLPEIERQFVVYNLDNTVSRKGPYDEFAKYEAKSAYELGFYMTMEDYGHPELAMTRSETEAGATRVSIYNLEKHEYVSSFVMPAGMTGYYVAGDYFVYQQQFQVEDRATSYDYFVGGSTTNQRKYDVVTARVNYVTGAVENLETKFLLGQGQQVPPAPLYDESGVYKYNLSSARVIREDKTLDPQTYSFILDDKMGVAGDVTGINFLDLYKVGENYLDEQSGILYNGKLNEIAYLPGAEVFESAIKVQGEFGYGLVDFNGKYITPLKYTFIQEVEDGVFYAGDEFAEYYLQLAEDGSFSKISTYDLKTYIPYEYADPFYTVYIYVEEIEEDPGYKLHYVNQITGKEVEPFEPAETDTYITSVGGVTYAGGAVESYYVLFQTEEGKLYTVQYNHVNTLGYNVLEAK